MDINPRLMAPLPKGGQGGVLKVTLGDRNCWSALVVPGRGRGAHLQPLDRPSCGCSSKNAELLPERRGAAARGSTHPGPGSRFYLRRWRLRGDPGFGGRLFRLAEHSSAWRQPARRCGSRGPLGDEEWAAFSRPRGPEWLGVAINRSIYRSPRRRASRPVLAEPVVPTVFAMSNRSLSARARAGRRRHLRRQSAAVLPHQGDRLLPKRLLLRLQAADAGPTRHPIRDGGSPRGGKQCLRGPRRRGDQPHRRDGAFARHHRDFGSRALAGGPPALPRDPDLGPRRSLAPMRSGSPAPYASCARSRPWPVGPWAEGFPDRYGEGPWTCIRLQAADLSGRGRGMRAGLGCC